MARNLGNGHHWLALQLGGHWRVKPELMRTNSHAIGTRLIVEGQGIHVTYDHTTAESGLAQSIGPVLIGLGKRETADLVHLRWPDGVDAMRAQCPRRRQASAGREQPQDGQLPGTFHVERYAVRLPGRLPRRRRPGLPGRAGVYGQPDRDEAIAIAPDQLRAEQGVFRLSITEPMDEVAYLDHLRLDVVDRPPGVSTTADERFAPTGPRPTGQVLAWRRPSSRSRATDLEGRDMTATLKDWDRRTVDTFAQARWLDRLRGGARDHPRFRRPAEPASAPADPLVLCLAGWVEYPYSQTNYAAATAGVALQPPTVERRRDDGTWQMIEPHAGYPAGLPRMTTLDLTGKLTGGRCVVRIRTNMECYYDQAFIAVRDRQAEQALRDHRAGRRPGGPEPSRLHPGGLARRPPAPDLRL